ncbi:sigma-54-dependent Fis family transcriptional regulator [Corticibacter populi]|uniref:Sigma-54-dependent Fis family transcriptional regulator n=1 Tax=Corticibacter populi TaxID=1550736 RepID=A0A3M6QKK9_9BURK|nr:sigma-54 dependent transcriptional regulator [Corticibacter populi]RMX03557.1 sigma-54-dependent Fis family transcriptional regulator [Corticibacter populi]RZS30007.1 two-component system C4-dicarboxylate transport response regulator DctD [Corticibacter populi]
MTDKPTAPPIRVLLVEDDADVRLGCQQALELAGFAVEAHASVETARGALHPGAPLVIVCDVRLPGTSGLAWLPQVLAQDTELPFILVTGHGDVAMAVQAMRQGAYDFIEKPFSSEQLVATVRRAIDKRRLVLQVGTLHSQLAQRDAQARHGLEAVLIGHSPAIERVRQTILALAATNADVLIYGETGTGKELVARCLHDFSARRQHAFVPLNCGGLPENLAESELFGHEAGAFTSAQKLRVGKFEYAHQGTLFLDEIESMPLAIQVKLLRALQERQVERIGSNRAIPIDTRVVAASKHELRALSERQQFRADLYYRIAVAFIELPPLRERREDIPLLFEHFCLLAARRYQQAVPPHDAALLATLMAQPWPGNVRELRNAADRHVLGLPGTAPWQPPGRQAPPSAPAAGGLGEQLGWFEKALITDALRQARGDVTAAAAALQLPKPTLYEKIRKLGIDRAQLQRED